MKYWTGNLKRLRKAKGFKTEKALADKAGVSQSIISGLESGKKRFTQLTLDKVLHVLDADYGDIFCFSNSTPVRKEPASKYAFSSKVIEFFDIAKHIEWINKAVDADDYDRAIERMELCVNDAKYILEEKKQVDREKNSKQSDLHPAIPFKSKKVK